MVFAGARLRVTDASRHDLLAWSMQSREEKCTSIQEAQKSAAARNSRLG